MKTKLKCIYTKKKYAWAVLVKRWYWPFWTVKKIVPSMLEASNLAEYLQSRRFK